MRKIRFGNQVLRMNCQTFSTRIEFGRAWRERQDGDVGGNVEFRAGTPRCVIDDEEGVSARRYGLRGLVEMRVHGVEVAPGQDEGRSLAQRRTVRSEDPGRTCALIGRRRVGGCRVWPSGASASFSGRLVPLRPTRVRWPCRDTAPGSRL